MPYGTQVGKPRKQKAERFLKKKAAKNKIRTNLEDSFIYLANNQKKKPKGKVTVGTPRQIATPEGRVAGVRISNNQYKEGE